MMELVLLRVAVVTAVMGCLTCGCQDRTVLTFNTGLTPKVEDYEERVPAVVEAIESHGRDADFMCLQEVWFEKDVKRILDTVGEKFPYHYSAIHHDVGTLRGKTSWSFIPERFKSVPCNIGKLALLSTCYGWYCRNAADKQACMMEQCRGRVYALSDECLSCMSMASATVSDLMYTCGNPAQKFNRVNGPGLLVLSKQPLTNVQYVNYHEGDKVLVERGYIKAQVEGKVLHVCTHLTAAFPTFYDVGVKQFRSYEGMQRAEIRQLNATFSSLPHVLMGDLNTGPDRHEEEYPMLRGEAPNNYDLLVNTLGYHNPYMTMDGRCTYCPLENPVLGAIEGGEGLTVDHVLLSQGFHPEVSSAQRVFDRPDIKLSDHFGVQTSMCVP